MVPVDFVLIRESFAHLHRRKKETAILFYEQLFIIAPYLRSLFKNDILIQGQKLVQMLYVAIATLDDQNNLTILLRKLGHDHKYYGVHQEDYIDVGKALILTLRISLKKEFTPEIEQAWTALYGEISKIMIEGET